MGDLWCDLWKQLATRTGHVHISWVPAHTTTEVVGRSTSQADHVGNHLVGVLAGLGAKSAEHDETTNLGTSMADGTAWLAQARIASVHLLVYEASTRTRPCTTPRARRRRPTLEELLTSSPHRCVLRTRGWQCSRCMGATSNAKLLGWMASSWRGEIAPAPQEPTAHTDEGQQPSQHPQRHPAGVPAACRAQLGLDEEDPFGHGLMGMDDDGGHLGDAHVGQGQQQPGGHRSGRSPADAEAQREDWFPCWWVRTGSTSQTTRPSRGPQPTWRRGPSWPTSEPLEQRWSPGGRMGLLPIAGTVSTECLESIPSSSLALPLPTWG